MVPPQERERSKDILLLHEGFKISRYSACRDFTHHLKRVVSYLSWQSRKLAQAAKKASHVLDRLCKYRTKSLQFGLSIDSRKAKIAGLLVDYVHYKQSSS